MIKSIKTIYTFIIILFWVPGLKSEIPRLEWTPELRNAYELVIELRLEEGRQLLNQSKRTDPENHLVYYIENYIDFFALFIGEDVHRYKELKSEKNKRIDFIKKTPPDSPWYLFCLAEINLRRGP